MAFTHFNEQGRARMVDVSQKPKTQRTATAAGKVLMRPDTLELVRTGGVRKGDVLAVAQVAGIMAAKRTWELVPMCHPVQLTGVDVSFSLEEDGIAITATCRCCGETGVEMEALTAASVAGLTIYDMCKAHQRDMVIDRVRLMEKDGPEAGGAAYNERTPQAGTATNAQGKVHLRTYGSMTYAAVLSMCSARLDRGDPRVRQSLDYLTRFWSVDENPGMGSQGLYYFYDIMARALTAAGVRKVGEHDWRRELSAKVRSLQRPDGSWANDNNRFWEADPVLCTSFALIVLNLCR